MQLQRLMNDSCYLKPFKVFDYKVRLFSVYEVPIHGAGDPSIIACARTCSLEKTLASSARIT